MVQIQEHSPIVRIQCTIKCNLNCEGCPISRRGRKDFKELTYEDAVCLALECHNLGGKCIEWAGGDPFLWPWIKEILRLCKDLGIATLLPVSGPGLLDCLGKKGLGTKVLTLPGMLRISTHVDKTRGVSLSSAEEALKVATSVRPQGTTQLGVVLHPGPDGNINKKFLSQVLRIAIERSALIHAVPAFVTWMNMETDRRWDEANDLWRNISDEKRETLLWFISQPNVLASGVKKVLDRLAPVGANNTETSVCEAGREVITIYSGNLIGPCFLRAYTQCKIKKSLLQTLAHSTIGRGLLRSFVHFKIGRSLLLAFMRKFGKGLEEALYTEEWLEGVDMRGTFKECYGCTAGCHGAMGHDITDPIERFYTM